MERKEAQLRDKYNLVLGSKMLNRLFIILWTVCYKLLITVGIFGWARPRDRRIYLFSRFH